MSDQTTGLMRGGYRFNGLARVCWGRPALAAVSETIHRRGAERVLLVVSPSLERRSAVAAKAAAALGSRCAGVFDGVQPHTPAPTVDGLARRLRSTMTDLVVTFGGGSSIDTVKVALAMLASGAERALELVGSPPAWEVPPVRQIAVPTTLSGAEFSDLAGVTDPTTLVKAGVAGPGVGPVEVILDPALSVHTPDDLWLSTGMRAVDHAVETVCSIAPTPYTDALALAGLEGLARSLVETRKDPNSLSARLLSQQAVWMASSGLDRTPFGASHGIGHQLGAVAGVAHGICSCVLLPAVLDWNVSFNAAQQGRIAEVLDAPTAGDGVRALLRRLGMPERIREAGVQRDQLPLISETALQNRWVRANPRPIETASDVMTILEAAW